MAGGAYANTFDIDFQTHALAVICRDPRILAQYQTVISPDYFDSEVLAKITEIVIDDWKKHRQLPTRVTLISSINKAIQDEQKRDQFKQVVRSMFKRQISDSDIVVSRLVDFGKRQAMLNAIFLAAKSADRGEHDRAIQLIREASLVGQDLASSERINYVESTKEDRKTWRSFHGNFVSTGLSHLDEAMAGGLRIGELGVVLAPGKAGKSSVLRNFGYGCVTHPSNGGNVLHITTELRKEMVAMRYDRLFAGDLNRYWKDKPNKFDRLVAMRVKSIAKGNLEIRGFPTRSFTPTMLRSILASMEAKPRMVVVDYADIMRPERRIGETRHEQAGIYEDLRAIAMEHSVAIWTASQANRGAMGKETLTAADFAESQEKFHVVDAAIGIGQGVDEKEKGTMRFCILGLRNAGDGPVIEANFDRNIGRIVTTSWTAAMTEVNNIVSATRRKSRKSQPTKKVVNK